MVHCGQDCSKPLCAPAGKVPTTMSSRESCQTVVFPSSLGWMAIAVRADLLCQLTFGHPSEAVAIKSLDCEFQNPGRPTQWLRSLMKRLQAYASGEPDGFQDIGVDVRNLSEFRQRVLECCRRVPYGTTISYGELAAKAGVSGAARAVGSCMAGNRIPLIIPCHRVVRSDGGLGHYSAPGGVLTKRRLLRLERCPLG
jgi:methylated-DNA-[protein]-cysteine S-methyltransferase